MAVVLDTEQKFACLEENYAHFYGAVAVIVFNVLLNYEVLF